MTTDVHHYRVYVEPLKLSLGGGYVAYAPELKGCISDGATPDEALRNVYDAAQCWIDAAAAAGEPVPSPEAIRQYA